MTVGAPTPPANGSGDAWTAVRQDGKLLFEYNTTSGLIRLRRWGRTFIVNLAALGGQPWLEDERLRQ